MAEGARSSVGNPEASLPELQAKLLQTQQVVKDKDVQLARVVDKMREVKTHIAQDKKTANETIQLLEKKLQETNKFLEEERIKNSVLNEQARKNMETIQALEQKLSQAPKSTQSETTVSEQQETNSVEMFSIDDKPEFAVEIDNNSEREEDNSRRGVEEEEARERSKEERRDGDSYRVQEIEELKFQVENLSRQNVLLVSELEEAKLATHKIDSGDVPLDSELSSALARRTEERDECRGDNARLAKKVKELLKGQKNMQALQQSLKAMEEDRNSLRSEYAKAQSDWLSQEQERMESFKVMLREAEEQTVIQRENSKAKIETLMSERHSLRDKIYQEFSDQLQAKTALISEFDTKLQQSQRRETDYNNKLTATRQQLQESIEAGQRYKQMINELEKEKERLLQETHAIQTSLDVKCTQLHQQVQQLQKRLKEKDNKPVEDVKVDSGEPLVALRAKHTIAKREALRLLDELGETKRRAAEQQTELRLEIMKYKSALAELQKFLRLDVFSTETNLELDTQKPVEVELQGMEMDQEQFADASQGQLEERVTALIACCEQAGSHLAGLQRAWAHDSKVENDDENRPTRVLQQALDQLTGAKSHASAIAKCVTDLSHHYQQLGDHLSSLSARLCDEASCSLGFKMIMRAALKICGASVNSSKKFKYAPLPKT